MSTQNGQDQFIKNLSYEEAEPLTKQDLIIFK